MRLFGHFDKLSDRIKVECFRFSLKSENIVEMKEYMNLVHFILKYPILHNTNYRTKA